MIRLLVFCFCAPKVFLQNNTLSGGLIVLGMSICAPLSAFWAVFGSVVSTATALGLGVAADSNRLYAGLYAYNGTNGRVAPILPIYPSKRV